jgi:hypothetical protein
VKIGFAIAFVENPPAFRVGLNAAHRALKFFKKVKVLTGAGLLFFAANDGRLQLFGFRMARDAYGACRGCQYSRLVNNSAAQPLKSAF